MLNSRRFNRTTAVPAPQTAGTCNCWIFAPSKTKLTEFGNLPSWGTRGIALAPGWSKYQASENMAAYAYGHKNINCARFCDIWLHYRRATFWNEEQLVKWAFSSLYLRKTFGEFLFQGIVKKDRTPSAVSILYLNNVLPVPLLYWTEYVAGGDLKERMKLLT